VRLLSDKALILAILSSNLMNLNFFATLPTEERLFPGPRHLGEKYQKQPIGLPADRSLNLSAQDDELLPQQRVFPPTVRLCLWSDRRMFRAQGRLSGV
jgi:hypothetical protein